MNERMGAEYILNCVEKVKMGGVIDNWEILGGDVRVTNWYRKIMRERSALDHLAKTFDAGPKTGDAELKFASQMVGALIGVRFYLGRLISQNLFRASDAEVTRALAKFISQNLSKREGEVLGSGGLQGWTAVVGYFKREYEIRSLGASEESRVRTAVVESLLRDLSLSNTELARKAATTEKQVDRIVEVVLLRKLARIRGGA
jgi:hypothetical protein